MWWSRWGIPPEILLRKNSTNLFSVINLRAWSTSSSATSRGCSRDRKVNLKRFLDISIIGLASIILLPLGVIVALLVYLHYGRPVIFRQTRPGKDMKPFTLYKFRSMTNEKDELGNLLPNQQRLTSFGRKLRASSLDELPSLINVLKGDMSLVGPRPLKMDYISLYNEEQRRRHEVKPGVTGWAQVNGRNVILFTERFKLDVWYVDNRSLWLDLKIIWMTFLKVLKRENIGPIGHREVEPFNGTN